MLVRLRHNLVSQSPALHAAGHRRRPELDKRPQLLKSVRRIRFMADDRKLSIMVERDEKRPDRYRWIILKDGVEHARSLTTYATRREAEAKAAKARALRTDISEPP
jgi:hypothetical protein